MNFLMRVIVATVFQAGTTIILMLVLSIFCQCDAGNIRDHGFLAIPAMAMGIFVFIICMYTVKVETAEDSELAHMLIDPISCENHAKLERDGIDKIPVASLCKKKQ